VSSRTRKKRREKSQKASRPTVQESGDDSESVGEPGGSGATLTLPPQFLGAEKTRVRKGSFRRLSGYGD